MLLKEPIVSPLKSKIANDRHIENRSSPYFFCFLLHFGLRRAAAFVSSPIHLSKPATSLFTSSPTNKFNSELRQLCSCCSSADNNEPAATVRTPPHGQAVTNL